MCPVFSMCQMDNRRNKKHTDKGKHRNSIHSKEDNQIEFKKSKLKNKFRKPRNIWDTLRSCPRSYIIMVLNNYVFLKYFFNYVKFINFVGTKCSNYFNIICFVLINIEEM